mmetsp:Transcript_78967/g.152505  ORF Transcript_78967/g.152505 Transcript_78967/m.152505 type:complete len:143 (+) Transcript_78967:15-443(+)|eukprot:CAMPEP_0172716196 /NCGR_PEP_ID=MMETSP1074-20121228/67983_1 /TAXON_ID=2916 /ORGANISM="Ceratium fusus, Strain PA161109" /LENGTH=142 /DNA_ID=CAMNT_0013540853 /DNA_START=14 /DNA_END=442 /DNA_ORIENTATION=+
MTCPALACKQELNKDAPTCACTAEGVNCALDEDPMWSVDWTNLKFSEVQYMPRAAEVYELHGRQTWLARLRLRRARAERALNQKLVRRISRDLAAASVEMPKEGSEANQQSVAALAAAKACTEDAEELNQDIWGLDWTALSL